MNHVRILVVEDENIIAMDLKRRLAFLGYEVVGTLATGEEAIEKADELHPDLILMDIVLKGKVDGIEAAQQIRAHSGPPVVFITAYSDDKTLQRARQVDPYGYIIKPFEDRELVASIEMGLYKHRVERELFHRAFHDDLTGLHNRAMFLERLGHMIQEMRRRPGELGAVLYMDLDRFKIINDSLGHPAGDQLLVEVARRLEVSLRPGDLVARLGGDEFAILLKDIHGLEDATIVTQRLLRQINQPAEIDGHPVYVGVSLGIALVTEGYVDAQEVLRDADTALYQAKENGRGRYEIFHVEMHHKVLHQLALEADLRKALEQDQFRLVYQPIVALPAHEIQGVEALLRWDHPERGLLEPGEFMSLAEETGLAVPINIWMLQNACLQVKSWHDLGFPELRVGVNVALRFFQDPAFLESVEATLRLSGLAPAALQLEIEETTILKSPKQATETLQCLRAMGVQVAIDRFSSSYATLQMLKNLQVDTLKIGKSYVYDVNENLDAAAMTASLIAIAHMMDVHVVAEGIDSQAQIQFLTVQHCDMAQGSALGKPQSAEAFQAALEQSAH
jgi:diguanylate cyclase (GGDEF)-like protein